MQQWVDVLVITYNQEAYIEECVRSILNQTHKSLRVLVFDDCSTDSTLSVLKTIDDPRLHLFPTEHNLGITGNCNRALSHVETDYFLLMGGDDIMYSHKIETQLQLMMNDVDACLCGHPVDVIDESGNKIGFNSIKFEGGQGLSIWLNNGMIYGALSLMYKTETIKSLGLTFNSKLRYSSDWLFVAEILGKSRKFISSSEALAGYRRHGGNITLEKYDECVSEQIEALSILKDEQLIVEKEWSQAVNFYSNYGYFRKFLQDGEKGVAFQRLVKFGVKSRFTKLRFYYGIMLFAKGLLGAK